MESRKESAVFCLQKERVCDLGGGAVGYGTAGLGGGCNLLRAVLMIGRRGSIDPGTSNHTSASRRKR